MWPPSGLSGQAPLLIGWSLGPPREQLGLKVSPPGCAQSASGDERTIRDNPGHLHGPSWSKPRRSAADRPDCHAGKSLTVSWSGQANPGLPQGLRQRQWPREKLEPHPFPLLQSQAVVPETRTVLRTCLGIPQALELGCTSRRAQPVSREKELGF